MNQLETLLSQILKMGWKPWGKLEANECTVEYQKQVCVWNKHYRMLRKGSLRELVSQESGLWRFVCENNLYKKEANNFRENVSKVGNNIGWFNHNYQYRLLESALVPEEELGKFLVDNIKMKC